MIGRKLQMDELNRISVQGFKEAEKFPIVIVLEDIRSLHNIGSVFRTADAFRVEKIFLCGITATPPHREINKTALGSTESVSWEYWDDRLALIQQLKNDRYIIAAVEQVRGSTMLENFNCQKDDRLALVFGNEVHGVSNEVIKCSDVSIEIPQFGTKHSLNISVSVGIVIWEIVKSKIKKKGE